MTRKVQKTQKPAVQLAQYWQREFRARRRFLTAAGGTIGVLIVALGFFNIAYAEKIFPGVSIGGIKAGGLTQEELAAKLDEKIRAVDGQDLKVTINGQEFIINPTKDWELSYNVEGTVAKAYSVGRKTGFLQAIVDQISVLFSGQNLSASYYLYDEQYRVWLEETTGKVEDPENDAKLVLHGDELVVEAEKSGKRIADDGLNRSVLEALGRLSFDPIGLSLTEVHPAINSTQVEALKPAVTRMIANNLTLKFQSKNFVISRPDLLGFIELAADPAVPEGVAALVSEPKILQYLESVASDIDQTPVDARLNISGGRASIFTPSRDGYQVKRDEAAKDIAAALAKRRTDTSVTEIELAVEVTKPAVRTETINDLGIKELIGRGTTTFTGSPPNRIHNITVGANSFNGLLIKPGETFSTVAALGTIDASTGYRAELVIKEDRLIPETGGGLCQVSTTLFRAALNAGLPIAERKNHSFRVRYYEPPVGMDATIYDPAPDLKFTNDTPGYILIQTKVEGTRLTFEFYGTKDGREATTSTPVVYNVTQPGDPVYIEDSSLAPGEQKQIEKAVPGADARFTYTVKKDGNVIYEKTFTSHYVAWRAKYLVGPAAPPPTEPTPPVEPTPPPA